MTTKTPRVFYTFTAVQDEMDSHLRKYIQDAFFVEISTEEGKLMGYAWGAVHHARFQEVLPIFVQLFLDENPKIMDELWLRYRLFNSGLENFEWFDIIHPIAAERVRKFVSKFNRYDLLVFVYGRAYFE